MKKTIFRFVQNRWREISRSKFSRQATLVFSANIFNALINVVAVVLMVRLLGPSLYGLLAIALSITAILGELGDLGLSTAILRFVPKYLEFHTRKARSILKAAWEIKLISGSAITVLGVLFAPTLAIHFFHKPELTDLFRIAFAGAFGILLSQFTIAVLQAKRHFLQMLCVQILPNVIKLIGILILWRLNLISPIWILGIFVAAFYISFLLGYFWAPKRFLIHKATYANSRRELISFTKWILIAVLFGSFYRQIDIILLGRFLDTAEVGIYAAAVQLTLPFTILTSSLQTVFFPRLTAISKKSELRRFGRKLAFYLGFVFLLCLPLAILLKDFVGNILGSAYLAAGPIFMILFFRAVLLGFRGLVTVLLCAVDKPQIISFTDGLRFVLLASILIYTIPRYGLYGAALTVLGVAVFGLLVEVIFLAKNLKKN